MLLQNVHNYVPYPERSNHVLDVLLLVQKPIWNYLLLLRDDVGYLLRRLDRAVHVELLCDQLFRLMRPKLLKAAGDYQIG